MSQTSASAPDGVAVGAEIPLPNAVTIDGFRLRRYAGPQDHPGMVRANSVARAAAGIVERVTVEGMDSDYASLTNSDPWADVVIGEVHGEIVSYGRVEWGDNSDGARDYTSFCLVSPDVRRRGVGQAMLTWQEARLREIAASQETDRPQFYYAFMYDGDGGGLVLLERAGYDVVRRGAEMVRSTMADIPDVPLPESLAFRAATAAHARAAWDADSEIFRDHWGSVDDTEEGFNRFVTNPKFDPSMWVVAWAGDEIAGLVLTSLQDGSAAGSLTGYLDSVGVRRAWRRRGLGRSLVAESLRLLRDRGASSAALGVDLQNQNEAARLYEGIGFQVETTSTELRKPLVL